MGVYIVIDKEPYWDVGQCKIPLRKDAECPTLYYLNLELAPRGNYQMEATFPIRVISGRTIPTGSALASRFRKSEAMNTVAPLATAARASIPTSTVASGLPGLRTTASAHGPRLTKGGTIEAASTSTASTSAPTITPGLSSAITNAAPAILTTVMMMARSEHPEKHLEHPNKNILHQHVEHLNERTM